MLEHNGIKIGVIGLVEKEWIATLATMENDDVLFEDFVDCANRLSPQLRAAGADIVIALTHMRLPRDLRLVSGCLLSPHLPAHPPRPPRLPSPTAATFPPISPTEQRTKAFPQRYVFETITQSKMANSSMGTYVCVCVSAPVGSQAEECGGDAVDLILGGHDHHYVVKLVKTDRNPDGTWLVKSGTDFRELSTIEVTLDRTIAARMMGRVKVLVGTPQQVEVQQVRDNGYRAMPMLYCPRKPRGVVEVLTGLLGFTGWCAGSDLL